MPLALLPGGGTITPAVQIKAGLFTHELSAYLGRYNIRGMGAWIPWYEVEPVKGTWDWSGVDRLLADAPTGICASRNAYALVHLACNSSWGAPGTVPGGPSLPPADPADYAAFIATIVDRYKGHGIHWSIENEPAMPNAFWGGTQLEYLALLSVAYAAFQTVHDPTAVLLPGGVASTTLILTVAKAIHDAGAPAGTAYDWATQAFGGSPMAYNMPPWWGSFPFDTEDNFIDWCNGLIGGPLGAIGPRIVGWVAAEIAANTYDRQHIHWHHRPSYLRQVLNWFKLQILGGPSPGKGFEAWELGWDWSYRPTFSADHQARGVAQLLATSVGEGCLSLSLNHWTTQCERVWTGLTGLVHWDTGEWRPGAHTYCYLAGRLHGLAPDSCGEIYSTANTTGYGYAMNEFQIWFRTAAGSATIDLTALPWPAAPTWIASRECAVTNLRTFERYASAPSALVIGADPILVEAMPEVKMHSALIERVLGTQPGHLAAFWPLAETERLGFRAYDIAPGGYHGWYHGCVLGEQGPGDGRPAVRLNGAAAPGHVDVWGTGLAGVFNGDAGTLVVWARGGADPWDTETTESTYLVGLYVDASNRVRLYAAGGVVVAERTSQGVAVSVSADIDGTRWHQYAVVWDPLVVGRLALYVDGALAEEATDTGALVGTLTASTIGRSASADEGHWRGRIGRVALWHTALSELEVAGLWPADWATWEVH